MKLHFEPDMDFQHTDIEAATPGQISRRLVCGLAVLMFATMAWGAEEPDLDVTFKAGWDNAYRPERWVPLSFIVVSKQKKPLAVSMTVSGQQDGMTNMTIDHDFVVTPSVPANVPMVTKLRHGFSNFDVAIHADKVRKVRWNNQTGGPNFAADSSLSLDSVPVEDMFIGLCGSGTAGLVQLPGHMIVENTAAQPENNGGRTRGGLRVKEKVINLLPWDWTGYDCLDLLILHDPDWNQINDSQARAIAAWVNNGGKLLLVLGSHPLPRDHVLAKMLPFVIGPARDVPLSRDQILHWELRRAAKQSVTCWTLPATKGWRAMTVNGDVPYFTRGLVGFGTVGVAAFTPTELSSAEPAAGFWSGIMKDLDSRCNLGAGGNEEDANSNSQSGYNRYEQYNLGETAENANAVLGYLQSIPEMRPLSIWWIIGLLSLLAVVLGPLDYFVLKRLDRLPMTWVTSTAVIVLFSVGAYYGVEKIRGGLMVVRAVTVTDAVQGQAGSCWSTTMCGIFAPSSDSYHLAGLKGNQWWSAMSPSQQGDYSPYGRQDATRNIYCSQQDAGNIPSALPINIWSMQCLRAETQSPAFPFIAKVELGADGQLKITLENRTDDTLTDACVRISYSASDVRSMSLGRVPPHSTQEFTGLPVATSDPLSGWSKDILSAFYTQGILPRTEAIARYHEQGAAVILARFTSTSAAFTVEGHNGNVNHIQLARLVVPNVATAK
jgi:hypothetical protein